MWDVPLQKEKKKTEKSFNPIGCTINDLYGLYGRYGLNCKSNFDHLPIYSYRGLLWTFLHYFFSRCPHGHSNCQISLSLAINLINIHDQKLPGKLKNVQTIFSPILFSFFFLLLIGLGFWSTWTIDCLPNYLPHLVHVVFE